MSYHQRTQKKMNQFKEDIKNEVIFEKKLIYLIKTEFDTTLNDILLLEPDSFIDRIENGINFFYENLYSENCLSDLKLISMIEKLLNLKKTEYSSIAILLRNAMNNYERNKTKIIQKEYILTNFRKHCINTSKIAKHNCGSQNANFILVKDKDNKIIFVICESCKKVYYSSYICCYCDHCKIDYYTNILNEDEDPNYMVATWENYHCPKLINEKMKCIRCNESFYLNMQTGMLTCLNKKCNYISEPDNIIWTCNVCQKDFMSEAIPYNPLEIKMVKNVIRHTLLLKHRAHPNNLPCCKLNVFFVEFFHKKICRGILYEGELDGKMIIVCEKCREINYYERFIWTCPKCLRKFQDTKNENNFEENNTRKNNFKDLIKKRSKYNSIGKNYLINNYKKNNIISKEKENIDEGNKENKYLKNLIRTNELKLGINVSPKKNGYLNKSNEKDSSGIIDSHIEPDKNGCIKITINNETGKKINNFIINNNNISIFYSKHNNEKTNDQQRFLKQLNSEQLIKNVSCGKKVEKKNEEKNNKNHHKEYVSKCLKRSTSACMNPKIENKYIENKNKNLDNQIKKAVEINKNFISSKNNNILKKRNYSIENFYHGKKDSPKLNNLKMVKVEYNPQKRKNRYCSIDNNRDSEIKVLQSEIQNNKINILKLENKPIIIDDENKVNNRKNKIRFHVNLNESNRKLKNENVNIRLKKYINCNCNKNQKEKDKINGSSIIENNIQEGKEDKKEKNKDINLIKENKNKIINNYNFKEIIVKKTNISDNEQKNNNIINNKNNENNIKNNFPYIPENIGFQNLVGLSEELITDLKLKINNIFSKSKLPIFNIEEYRLIRRLGEGTYGIIYSVIKISEPTKEYALKKIIAKSVKEVNNFINEFELVYSCDHPNIMKIYGFCLRILDSTTFAIYVLMEKSKYDWDKEINSHLSKRKYYTEKELINILRQLCEALLFLKNKFNISHRDIKPQNVLVFDGDIYKLADFGEAKEIKISKKLNTLRGTELYMSPVLYEGLKHDKDNVSHDSFKSDVFSLGFCFLYAAGLNFNLLYEVRDITNNETLENIIHSHLTKIYSKNFVLIVSLMLKMDEVKRYGFSEIIEFINSNYK